MHLLGVSALQGPLQTSFTAAAVAGVRLMAVDDRHPQPSDAPQRLVTVDIAKVSIIRGDQILYVHTPNTQEVEFEYLDESARRGMGTQYYYVRLEQSDGNVAWASPFWVNY